MAYLVKFSVEPRYRPLFRWENKPPEFDYPFLEGGKTVPIEHVPKRAILTSRHKTLPDFVPMPASDAVCEAFRVMVEEREPGIHQFFPVEIVRRGSLERLPGTYYLLNVRQTIDPIVEELSNVYRLQTEHGPGALHLGRGPVKLILKKQIITGRHLWRGEQQFPNQLFFSDELTRAVERAGLKKIEVTKLEELEV